MTLPVICPEKSFFPEKTRRLAATKIGFKAPFSAFSQLAGTCLILSALLLNLRNPPWMPEHPTNKEKKTKGI